MKPAARPPRFPALAADALAVLACVALTLWMFRSVPGAFFSPDDLIYLERLRGIVPQPPGPWRWLSGVAYFQLAYPMFGVHPMPWMVAQLVLHALCVVALYAWMRALGGGLPAATAAAALFGASRLHYTVIAQVCTVAEPLCVLFAIAALGVARRAGWAATALSLALFVAALLSKESVMLLPLLLLIPGIGPDAVRLRVLRCGLMLVPVVALALVMVDPRVHAAIFVNQVYERAWGMHPFHNLMTLTGWTMDFHTITPDLEAQVSTTAWQTAGVLLATLAIIAALAWRSSRRPAAGLAWYVLSLAPVLPLLHQRYLHYLYVPSVGLAMALASAAEWLIETAGAARTPRRSVVGWAIVAGLIAASVASSDALLVERQAGRIQNLGLPSDPFVRKMETSRRAVTAVKQAIGDRHVRAVFVVPSAGWATRLGAIFRSVLGEGRALEAAVPNLDSAVCVTRWSPAYEDFELFYGRVDGNVVDLGRGPDAQVNLVTQLLADGCIEDARGALTAALAAWPADRRLRDQSDRLAAALGGR